MLRVKKALGFCDSSMPEADFINTSLCEGICNEHFQQVVRQSDYMNESPSELFLERRACYYW